jgi:hypothetical protein
MKRMLIALLVALPMFAAASPLFTKYEVTRQALLAGKVAAVQSAAKSLAAAAQSSKQPALAARANELAKASTLAAARTSFGALSEEMIRYRSAAHAKEPVVVYCSMEKKSWLQPKGAVTNPYVHQSMRSCGEVRQ